MLTDSAQVSGQRHDVAATVASREVGPFAGPDVDFEASSPAVIARWIDRLPFEVAESAFRQPAQAERVQVRQCCGVDSREVD